MVVYIDIPSCFFYYFSLSFWREKGGVWGEGVEMGGWMDGYLALLSLRPWMGVGKGGSWCLDFGEGQIIDCVHPALFFGYDFVWCLYVTGCLVCW